MDGVLPSLEQFLAHSGPRAAGDPPPGALPDNGSGIAPTVVGRGAVRQPTVMHVISENGHSLPVDLTQLTPDRVARAIPPAHAVADQRDAAAAAYHALASSQRATGGRAARPDLNGSTVRTVPYGARPAVIGGPEVGPANAPQDYTPTGYVEQNVARPAAPARPVLVAPPQMAAPAAPPPTQQVTFEVPNYGPLDVYFHQVVRSGDHLVLVSDTRHAGQRGFPRHGPHPIGVHVHGTDKLFAARTTGIEFMLGHLSVCVLGITREGSYRDFAAAADPLADRMSAAETGDDRGEEWGDPGRGDAGGGVFGTPHDAVPGY